jgi:hypothetical protein
MHSPVNFWQDDMLTPKILLSISRRAGALLLGALILWQVAEHSGPMTGRAIVHVATLPANVTVDDVTYNVESLLMSPIVCDLSAGRHTVLMLQQGRVLYEEQFTVKPGEELILTAWDGYKDGRSPAPVDQARDTLETSH